MFSLRAVRNRVVIRKWKCWFTLLSYFWLTPRTFSVWSLEKLSNKIFDMRDLYQQCLEENVAFTDKVSYSYWSWLGFWSWKENSWIECEPTFRGFDWFCEQSANTRVILLDFGTCFIWRHVLILICWANKILFTANKVAFQQIVSERLQFVSPL